jgi:hypothetical protein
VGVTANDVELIPTSPPPPPPPLSDPPPAPPPTIKKSIPYVAVEEKEIQELDDVLYHSIWLRVELYPNCPATGEVGRPAVVHDAGTVPVVPSNICAIASIPFD